MRATMRKMLFPRNVYLLGLLLSSCSSSLVLAQAALDVEEVVVTAQMREEKLQSIPVSIGAYDKSFISTVGASSLTEMEMAIPSINFGSGDRSTRGEIAIRGIGDYARNIGTNARVAVYIDGVLTGRSSSFDQGLLDVAQIEVLRGPQGTLSGTNALAGSINIITEKPGDAFKAELLANIGNYDFNSLTGKLNIPLSEHLFASVLLGATERDGYIYNHVLDRDLQGINRDVAKLKLRYIGVDQLVLDVGFDYLKDDVKSTNSEALANGLFNGYTRAPAPFEVAHDADEFEQRELKGATVEAVYETSENYRWSSITGIRSNEFRELSEEDYSPLNVAVSVFDEKSEQFSQEFRFASPKGGRVDYVVGAYFLDQDISTERQAITGPAFPAAPNAYAQTPGEAKVDAASIYLHGNYHFDSRWSLTAGVRYVNESKSIDYSIIDLTGWFIDIDHLEKKESFNEWLPKVGVNFQVSPDVLFYSSVARGYKSGGWNADFLSTLDNFQFNSEYAINYEVGIKSSFFERRLTLNSSAFMTQFDDFQVFQFLPTPADRSILILTNAGKAKSQGVEFDINLLLTQNLSFTLNTSLTSAKFEEFRDGGGFGVDLADHHLPYAPQNNYYAALDYVVPVFGTAEIYAHVDYSYTDNYFSQPNNIPDNAIPSRDLSNARIGMRVGAAWDFSLWVKNISDNASLRQKSRSFLRVPRGVYTSPRMYGVEIKYQFD